MSDLKSWSAATLVEHLRLAPHPEGGWFREVHRSPQVVQRPDGEVRSGLTLIWFLLTDQDISRWHRVVGADETWHHAGGAPLELWVLPPTGGVAERRLLASFDAMPTCGDGTEEAQPVQVVPADWWQAARSTGAWSLVTCCVGPGFAFEDFQLLHHWPVADHPAGVLPELL